jgi:hypothetical protein
MTFQVTIDLHNYRDNKINARFYRGKYFQKSIIIDDLQKLKKKYPHHIIVDKRS